MCLIFHHHFETSSSEIELSSIWVSSTIYLSICGHRSLPHRCPSHLLGFLHACATRTQRTRKTATCLDLGLCRCALWISPPPLALDTLLDAASALASQETVCCWETILNVVCCWVSPGLLHKALCAWGQINSFSSQGIISLSISAQDASSVATISFWLESVYLSQANDLPS